MLNARAVLISNVKPRKLAKKNKQHCSLISKKPLTASGTKDCYINYSNYTAPDVSYMQ